VRVSVHRNKGIVAVGIVVDVELHEPEVGGTGTDAHRDTAAYSLDGVTCIPFLPPRDVP
jgi:hypothetical protein